jgi:hypothetical protein
MSLRLLGMIHVGTQDTLHGIGFGAVLGCMLIPIDMSIIIVVR